MQTIIAVSKIVIGYLSASVNYAIAVTRVVAGSTSGPWGIAVQARPM